MFSFGQIDILISFFLQLPFVLVTVVHVVV